MTLQELSGWWIGHNHQSLKPKDSCPKCVMIKALVLG